MEDLVADPRQPGEEEQRDDVRVDERVEEAREEARVYVVDLRAGEMQNKAFRARLVAVELLQQGGKRRRDRVDDVHLQRLLRGEVRRLRHRQHGPLRVAVM